MNTNVPACSSVTIGFALVMSYVPVPPPETSVTS